jgi:hypothetical protein
MDRRAFLQTAAAVSTGLAFQNVALGQPTASVDDPWLRTWHSAVATLSANVQVAPGYAAPVLYEGPIFQGIWLECGPHESLAYAELADHLPKASDKPSPLQVALNSHRIFFANQRADGQFPAHLNHRSGIDYGQIQTVVPIAATAWQVAQMSKDGAFLREAYSACAKWDDFLRTYRNTRGTGLVEAFCTYDTGQDNSPRWKGVSDACPVKDARRFTPGQSVPRLCPDLSATAFGGWIALSAMAKALGKPAEAGEWANRAEQIRRLIIERLWCEEDASFYDVAPDDKFVRIRSVANMRVLGEHVLRLDDRRDRRIFRSLWDRQLGNPKAYWAPFPFPSIALDDPAFVRPIPFNSWGGASQALTALRTLRWMDHYGKRREQDVLLEKWCAAIIKSVFEQQLDPVSGVATRSPIHDYSPAALVFLHGAKRLGRAPSQRV